MSRRFLFVLAAIMVMLYFSFILIMLNPLHSTACSRIKKVKWCMPLGLRVPPGPVVALASFPGSGNTWLRYLLQQSTGILTGSLYNDTVLLTHGFPGESELGGSVLVVKTHETPGFQSPFQEDINFQSAILLIRHPKDVILTEYNRKYGGHIGTAPKKEFMLSPGKVNPDWSNHLYREIFAWESFYKTWLTKFFKPLHIVFYEELVRDLSQTLRGIFKFLHIEVTEHVLNCTLRNRQGIYRRRHKHKNFDPFTPEMIEEIDKVRNRVLDTISLH